MELKVSYACMFMGIPFQSIYLTQNNRNRKKLYYTDPWFNFVDNLVSLSYFLSLLFFYLLNEEIVFNFYCDGKVHRQLNLKAPFIWNSTGKKAKSHTYICLWEYNVKLLFYQTCLAATKQI